MKTILTNIPRLTGDPNYRVDHDLDSIQHSIGRYITELKLDMNPDFQRGHVWSTEQKRKWIEFLLKGGKGADILLNHPNWMDDFTKGPFTVVDGKQRLTTCLEFMNDDFGVFATSEHPEGWKASEIDPTVIRCTRIGISINKLKTRRELLQWYLELNEGHIAHQPEEIQKVKDLLEAE